MIVRPENQKDTTWESFNEYFAERPNRYQGPPGPELPGASRPRPLTPLSLTSKASLTTLRPCWVEVGGWGSLVVHQLSVSHGVTG